MLTIIVESAYDFIFTVIDLVKLIGVLKCNNVGVEIEDFFGEFFDEVGIESKQAIRREEAAHVGAWWVRIELPSGVYQMYLVFWVALLQDFFESRDGALRDFFVAALFHGHHKNIQRLTAVFCERKC